MIFFVFIYALGMERNSFIQKRWEIIFFLERNEDFLIRKREGTGFFFILKVFLFKNLTKLCSNSGNGAEKRNQFLTPVKCNNLLFSSQREEQIFTHTEKGRNNFFLFSQGKFLLYFLIFTTEITFCSFWVWNLNFGGQIWGRTHKFWRILWLSDLRSFSFNSSFSYRESILFIFIGWIWILTQKIGTLWKFEENYSD